MKSKFAYTFSGQLFDLIASFASTNNITQTTPNKFPAPVLHQNME